MSNYLQGYLEIIIPFMLMKFMQKILGIKKELHMDY